MKFAHLLYLQYCAKEMQTNSYEFPFLLSATELSPTIGSFRLDYKYKTEYDYAFRFLNQWRFQSPSSSCWF